MSISDIKKDLINTDLTIRQISDKHGVATRTVRNINLGSTYYDRKLKYPLRITGVKIEELKNKLKVPTKKAVPNPHILSPQLLDYVGFLSLLGVEISCLLEFKEVYIKQLTKVFGRELTNQEILSVIELRPLRPRQLSELIKAYDKPKVKLINTEFWLKKKLIDEGEASALGTLLLQR